MDYNEQVYLYNRPDSAIIMAKALYQFADSIDNLEYKGKATNFEATANAILGDYDAAEKKFLDYLSIAEELGDDKQITAVLKNLGNVYDLKSEYDKAIEYHSLALSRAEKTANKKEIMGALYGLSKVQVVKGMYDEAIPGFERVLKMSRETMESRIESGTLHQLVLVNQEKGDYVRAIEYGIEGLKIGEEINDKRLVANFTNAIGGIYEKQGENELALKYYQKSLDAYTELGMKNGIGGIYQNFANIYMSMNDLDESLAYYEKSLKIHEEINDKLSVIFCLIGISINYQSKENLDQALDHANRALSISKSIDSKEGLTSAYRNISSIQYDKRNYRAAISTGSLGLKLASELDMKARIKSISQTLYKSYKAIGDASNALKMHETYLDNKSFLEKEENISTVLKSTFQYESDKRAAIDSIQYLKQTEILSAENKHQSNLLKWSLGALLMFLLLSYFIFRLYRQTNKQNEIISHALKEKDTLLREIHHRVKNNLQLVSSLLTLQSRHVDDPKALEALNSGKARVKSMALIHQNLYNKENLTGINIKNYLEKLCTELINTYHIDEEKIKLTTSIQDIDLDIDTIVPLGLIINELITNAIKYAFPGGASGEINIKLEEINDELRLSISDNGVGLPKDYGKKNSFGYKLITTLNDQLDGKMEQLSDNGTTINLYIKDYQVAS